MPSVQMKADNVKITNMRDFYIDEAGELVPHYIDHIYDLKDIEGVDLVYVRFSDVAAVAHTFVTFRFKSHPPIAISIEARREKEEDYSPWLGLLRTYEEIYVVGTERDLIGRRSHIREEEVYVYPGETTPEKSRELLVDMLDQVQALYEEPAFYNSITNQCTTKLAWHIRKISERSLPRSFKVLLPGYSNEYAYEMGFLQDDLTFESLHKKSYLDPSLIDLDDPEFSSKIRE